MLAFLNLNLWLVLGGVFLLGGLLVAGAWQSRITGIQKLSRGLLVSYITLLVMVGAAEGYMRFAYADSGWDFTLAFQNWRDRYWEENERGFRDRDWTADDLAGKETIAILGDSFASGWGVNDPDDRFGDVLNEQLGDDYAVVNLARPGMSTPQQLDALQANPPDQPDAVILQYFLNDIELASASVSRYWEEQFVTMPDDSSLAAQSHLANFIYWILYPYAQSVNTTFEGSYWNWQYETYDDAAIWAIHERELNTFIDYVESLDAELYVVIFPNMEDPVGSVPYVDRVKFVFEERGYGDHVMTLYDDVATWIETNGTPPTASPRDAHPSAAFHRYVGNQLYDHFFAPDARTSAAR